VGEWLSARLTIRRSIRGGSPSSGRRRIDLPAIVAFLKSHKVVVNYIPERLLVLDALPVTPSGRVQKFKLGEMLRENGAMS
jgi:acyl-CoA synthetase (AMP-forming)/AMP-acid ligase II